MIVSSSLYGELDKPVKTEKPRRIIQIRCCIHIEPIILAETNEYLLRLNDGQEIDASE